LPAAILINHPRAAATNGALRIALQVVDLSLKFFRRIPIVVAFNPRDESAAALPQAGDAIRMHPEISGRKQRMDFLWKPCLIFEDDLPRQIGGAVLSYDDFIWERDPLCQHAVQGLADILLMVVGNHENTNQRIFAAGHS